MSLPVSVLLSLAWKMCIRDRVDSNQLFLTMPRPVSDELFKDYFFYFCDEAIHEIRFVTSFDTTEGDIEQLLQSVKRLL